MPVSSFNTSIGSLPMAARRRTLALPGRTTMAIRSGRFKGNASGTDGIPIIAAKTGMAAAYRIFNSGDDVTAPSFQVHAGHPSAPVVQPTCSLDVLITKTKGVTIKTGTTDPVVGSYDYLDRGNSFRSGRFKGNASGSGITIVLGKAKKLYRIFNSGDTTFNVVVGGSSTPLASTFSLDVAVGDDVIITAGGNVEGIYEYLGSEPPLRSGRFNLKTAPTPDHKIIDLSSSTPEAFYRVFNSGSNGFKLQAGGSDLTDEIGPEQSFDFTIGSNRDITVVPAKNYPIEGIYDLLNVEA